MFASHRVVELHALARARAGVVSRAYSYLGESGEVAYAEGEQTADDRDFGLDFWILEVPPRGRLTHEHA